MKHIFTSVQVFYLFLLLNSQQTSKNIIFPFTKTFNENYPKEIVFQHIRSGYIVCRQFKSM